MQWFNVPAPEYQRLLTPQRVGKFTRIHLNSARGQQVGALFLQVAPIEDVPLYFADPGYTTNLTTFFPVYLGQVVMLGYLIVRRTPRCTMQVYPHKLLVHKAHITSQPFVRNPVNRHLVIMTNDSANVFIPALKYEVES